jgi:deoxyadenosine/deoxycytidine kinase
MLIALEGVPGAGKTTSTRLVSELLGASALVESTGVHPFLDSVYDEENRFDLEIELAFLLLHAGAYRRIDRSRTTIADFSPAKDVIFAEDLLAPADFELWLGVYDRLYAELPPPDLVVFLRLPPEVCLERIGTRGREFEHGLTLGRLQRLEQLYEQNLDGLADRTVVLDLTAEECPDQVAGAVAAAIESAGEAG